MERTSRDGEARAGANGKTAALAHLLAAADPVAVTGPTDREVLGIVSDSRQVRPGYLFVAVCGEARDGWAFVNDALERGAVAVVSDREANLPKGVCHVRVRDPRTALGALAAAFHGRPSERLFLVSVTGTSGKTTVCYATRDVLRAAGMSPGMVSTVQYEIGSRAIPAGRTTPDAASLQGLLAQMVAAGCQSAVLEVSSHALAQQRTAGTDFDIAVFTNLSHEHLDYHGSMEAYFQAKSLLFEGLGRARRKAWAVLNADDSWSRRMREVVADRAAVLTYGLSEAADVRARDVRTEGDETRFRLATPWGERDLAVRLLGNFNVSNLLAAAACGGAAGVKPEVVAEALCRFGGVPGRLERLDSRRGFSVYVDYAHKVDALEQVLQTLRGCARNRLIAVFGCGGNRDRAKRPLMGQVAARLADYTILTSDNPRNESPGEIIAQIRAGFGSAPNFEIIEDRAQAIRHAMDIAREGDVVVVAGKGHETFQEFANTSVPFDDREVVKRFL